MKILHRGVTPDKFDLQIEDWSENYSFMPYANTVAIYPTNQFSNTFRMHCNFESDELAMQCFLSLKNGSSKIEDYNFFGHNEKYIITKWQN